MTKRGFDELAIKAEDFRDRFLAQYLELEKKKAKLNETVAELKKLESARREEGDKLYVEIMQQEATWGND